MNEESIEGSSINWVTWTYIVNATILECIINTVILYFLPRCNSKFANYVNNSTMFGRSLKSYPCGDKGLMKVYE